MSKMSTTPPDRSHVNEIAENAIVLQAQSSTFRLIDQTKLNKGGTVVAVNIGSRFFLATARHVIPRTHRFLVVLKETLLEGASEFAARHVHPDVDVGLLELHAKDAHLLGDNFVTPERFLIDVGQEEVPITVMGYPGDLISSLGTAQITETDSITLRECEAFTFQSATLPVNEWPREGLRTPSVPGQDIFISFHPEDSMRRLHPSGADAPPPPHDKERPNPEGISGGGIWVMRKAIDTTLWLPRAFLCGIQFGVDRDNGWLRGASLNVWLDVVEHNYPDLKPLIDDMRSSSPPTGG